MHVKTRFGLDLSTLDTVLKILIKVTWAVDCFDLIGPITLGHFLIGFR